MLTDLHQMQHHLNYMCSGAKSETTEFLLENEIKYILEGLTCNLNEETSLKFVHDDRLPDTVQGDLKTLRLAISILVEFAMKNCASGVIVVKTHHDGVDAHDRNTTKVGFSLILSQSDST